MKIAVTGATGFIGRYIIKALLAQGHDIVVVGRSAPAEDHRLTFIRSDLLARDNYSWIADHRPSHLLHLAWYAEHGKFWTSPLNLDWCDVTVRLTAAFCEYGGERIVIAGSCAEYDWSFGYCREEITPINPTTLYGIAKDSARRMAERICQTHRVSFAWGRIFFPFGPGEHTQRLIPSVAHALLGWRPPFAINTQHWRDFLPVESIAAGFVFLLNQKVSGVFNICSGRPTQLSELIRYLGTVLDKDPAPLLARTVHQKDIPHFLVGDNTVLLNIGWQPKYDLWDSLQYYAKSIAETQDYAEATLRKL